MTDPDELLAAVRSGAVGLPDTLETPATTERLGGAARTWTRDGIPFAILGGGTVEVRVGAAIAAAAVRTPDTTSSGRGPDWVAFTPTGLDPHALDRLGAWLGAAHRRAAPDA